MYRLDSAPPKFSSVLNFHFSLRFLGVVVGAGSRSAQKQSFTVGGVDEIDSAGFIRAVLCLKGVNDDLGSDWQRLLCVAQAD